MQDYFKKSEYVIENLWFDYLENRYQGRGILSWDPSTGLHLEALLNREKMRRIEKIELGRVRIIRKSDISSICMRPWNTDRAIAPEVILIDREDILFQHRLSINLNRVIFFEPTKKWLTDDERRIWIGHAIYRVQDIEILSDRVSEEVRIDGALVKSNNHFCGISYKTEEQTVLGRLIDKHHLQIDWYFSKSSFSKSYSWKWAEAAQDALSILLGQTVHLLYQKLSDGLHGRREIRNMPKVEKLGVLSPFYGKKTLDKNLFIKLTDFFVKNESESEICRNIFRQMVEASRQKNYQTQELLISTILEAALRNIDQHPFRPKKDKWNVGKSLERFLQTYLSEQWMPLVKPVMASHAYLRDRNAHPDWLFSQGGSRSEEERDKALDSMVFLSQFYGYMILALAGFENLEPYFPISHKQWEAPVTMTPAKWS